MAVSANERRIVELVLKATGDAELKRMTAELRATREAAQGSQKALSGMSSGLASVGRMATGFIAGLGVSTIIAWTRAIFEAADALDAAAEQAGIGVERYQLLKEAFRSLEVDGKKFETGMERLASTLSDTLAGDTGKATQALDELGIATKIYSGEVRTTEDLVDALAGAQSALGDDMKFTALVVDILGRKLGVDFANALKEGKLQTAEMTVAQEGFTAVTEDQIKVLADSQEAFDRWRTDATNSVLGFAADAIAGFRQIGIGFSDMIEQIRQGQNPLAAAMSAAGNRLIALDRAAQTRAERAANPGAWYFGGAAGPDRAPVARPPSTARPGGGGGGASTRESNAAREAREREAAETKKAAEALEAYFDAQREAIKADDDRARALTEYRFALERAADPLIEFTAEMDRLNASRDALSDQAFATEQARLVDALNDTRNALFENSDAWRENEKAMAEHDAQAQVLADAWQYVADAVGQATYDIITGTGKVSDAVKQMVGSILAEIARLAAIKLAGQIVGMLFGAAGGIGKSGGTVGTGDLKLFGAGGVTTGPTAFAMGSGIGIAGEAGAEVIAPLRRDNRGNMGVGAVAPKVVVNNYAGADVGVTQTPEGLQIDIVRRAIADDIRRGGNPVSTAIEGAYRVGRQAAAFS